jgi:hypothetical protein
MKHCIVNFSDNRFIKGQDRLRESLISNYQGDFISFNDFSQVGSKTHLEVPYQFKVFAINKVREMGYDIVLYCDASMYAIKNTTPIIDYINENGYLLEYCRNFQTGKIWTAAQFSTDLCLSEFNITRDEAGKIPLHSAGFTGLNFKNEIANKFFEEWLIRAKEEKAFIGDWSNANKQCSQDSRCLGHRHDQTCASIIAHKLDMNRINPYFMQYDEVENKWNNEETTIFKCRGIF